MSEAEMQREIERWKRSIRELPEELFFSIMRTYLGRLSTPFHKHTLAEQLAGFLSREETQRRIVDLVDEDDARILTAVDLLGGAGTGELYRLLESEYDYFTFHSLLLNLQERLLIYSEAESGALRLTPQLTALLRSERLSAHLLFPVQEARRAGGAAQLSGQLSADTPWLREELLWSLVAFFRRHPAAFKYDGELRKKRRSDVESIFPALAGPEGEARTELLLKAAERLRLLRRREGRAELDRGRYDSFAALPRRSRHELLWAAAVLPAGSASRELPAAARIIGDLLHVLPEGGELKSEDLQRLIGFLSYRQNGTVEPPFSAEQLRSTGLLEGSGERFRRSPLSISLKESEEAEQPLIIHSDFTATAATPLPFRAGLFLADLFDLHTFTVYPQLSLTKHSFTACRKGFSSFDAFLARLEELLSSPLPPNIRASLQNWEQNYSGVSLTRGIVLQIDAGRKHLVEHNGPLNELMLEVLAEGVYLFRDDDPERLLQLLGAAGVEPLPPLGPRYQQASGHTPPEPAWPTASESQAPPPPRLALHPPNSSPAPPGEAAPSPPSTSKQKGREETDGELDPQQRSLIAEVEALDVEQGTRETLERLVKKKVIIFPSQIRADLKPQKMSEARGIDYAGKVRVIEETLSSSWDVLELVERDPKGSPIRHLLRPVRLQKMGNDLLLYGREFPHMAEVTLRVRKLSYVRRWPNSLVIRPEGSGSPEEPHDR